MNDNSRPEFVTDSYIRNNNTNSNLKENGIKEENKEVSKDSTKKSNNSIVLVAISFFITILNLYLSFQCIGAKLSQNTWNTVRDPVAAGEFVAREANLRSYYDRFHFLFLGVAVVCELVAIYSLFTKKNLLAKLMSIFMIICNGFVIYSCLYVMNL